MTDKILKILVTAIGRETVDRFVENADGDLVGYATVSLEELAKEISKLCDFYKVQIRKDAAREVLQKWAHHNAVTGDEDGYVYHVAEEYGVEVDDD